MSSPAPPSTAETNGRLWGARAEAWAEQEPQSAPMYETALRVTGVSAGTDVLDVGCGAGSFCRLAADAGARASGLDASESLLELARRRVPEGAFRLGDLERLQYADGSFDVVTGFNAFQFAADPVAALREARRVARRDGRIVAVVWAEPSRLELSQVIRAAAARLPAPSAQPAPSLSDPGALETAVRAAGLRVCEVGEGSLTFAWPDRETMLRLLTSAGGMVRLAEALGEETLCSVVTETMERFREPGGGYRLRNDWRYVVAGAYAPEA